MDLVKVIQRTFIILTAVVTPALLQANAYSQVFPTKSVRVIVGFPPGGGTDMAARNLSQKLTTIWGQQTIVDNRGGAGGMIALELVANSPADGYTMFFGTLGNLSASHHLFPKARANPIRDFAPVTLVGKVDFVLVSPATLPVNNVTSLISLARKYPSKLSIASSGAGSGPHLAAELFRQAAKINLLHIPYKGLAQTFTDLVSGQVTLLFDGLPHALPYVRAGRIKAIGLASKERSSMLPTVQTFVESGIPEVVISNWYGLVVPVATPKETISRISDGVLSALKDPELQKRFKESGTDIMGGSPEDFGAFMQAESAKWGKLIKEAKIQAE